MKSSPTIVDVAIVGGGMAGLAAATYLARAGKMVTLFGPNLGEKQCFLS